MTTRHAKPIVLTLATIITLTLTTNSNAAGPVKLVLSSHIGWEVDKTTKGKVCTLASKHECQPGSLSHEPGGFEYPEDVAGAPNGKIYVADKGNHRVQELTATGEFVLMFGKEVNATTHANICTEEEIKTSGVKCTTGTPGTEPEAFGEPQSIIVDPVTTNVYILDFTNKRIDEYTATGQFILTIGKEVNETNDNTTGTTETQKNLCTAASGNTCKAGVQAPPENTEMGAFNFAQFAGNLLAVSSGPNHTLYVGDEHRVQEFNSEGTPVGESKLPGATIQTEPNGRITAVAIDSKTEALYTVYNLQPIVRQLNPTSEEEIKNFTIPPQTTNATAILINAIAIDAESRLAITATEIKKTGAPAQFGSLYDVTTSHLITKFTIEGVEPAEGISFNGNGELFAAIIGNYEVSSYKAEAVAEVITTGSVCDPGIAHESSGTFDCVLNGEVNPYNVMDTEAWFEWGRTCVLGSTTIFQGIETVEALLPVSAQLEGLRPNAAFCFRVAGVDQNVQSPEELTGEQAEFTTPVLGPEIVGEPNVSFITGSSADMFGELNPENAPTEYYFEYAPATGKALEECAGVRKARCVGVTATEALQSAQYGNIGATVEANGLQPGTAYRYRLAAANSAGQATPGVEKEFSTAAAPKVQAETLPASAITTTSAIATGLVNPDGQPAVYSFELGPYNGNGTQYATVFSGETKATTSNESESFPFTGLQPGTTYAYRISIHSGYGTAQAQPVAFTTTGIPVSLNAPPPTQILSSPSSKQFPSAIPACKHGTTLNKHNHCVKPTKKPAKTHKKTKTKKGAKAPKTSKKR